MSIRVWSGLKAVVVCVAMTLVAGCGGGGGGEPPPVPPDTPLALMWDSLGRQVPEADFGQGDPAAAGADGIAFGGGSSANAQVTLADNGGNTRTATTDASGYYRVNVKGLSPPFVVKATWADGTEWASASASAVRPRSFVTINVNGVTDKMVGYLSDAAGHGGAAGAVTPSIVAADAAALAAAKARVVYGLTVPLINAGLDAAVYDPVTAAFGPAAAASHETFLRGLVIGKNVQGRTAVVGTLAGGRTGFTDGAATVARFDQPTGIAVDAAGRILVADKENHAIRLISRTGVVTTVAGTGTGGFVNGNVALARFFQPTGVTADGAGNVYVAEGNHAIRKISPAGEVTTFAGSLYGYLDGPALTARFGFPWSVVADRGGNLYVADVNNASIRKVTPAGVVSTLAGRGPVTELTWDVIVAQGFIGVGGAVAVDANGLVYIPAWVPLSGPARLAIFSVDASGALAPRSALYSDPTNPGLAVDSHGNLYYGRGAAIYKVTPAGVETEVVGSGVAYIVSSRFALDPEGNLVLSDTASSAIRIVLP